MLKTLACCNTPPDGLFQQVFNVKSPGPLSVTQLLYIILSMMLMQWVQ